MQQLLPLTCLLAVVSFRVNAIICVIPGVCPTITTTATKTEPAQTVIETKVETVMVPGAAPTPYAVLEVFTNNKCELNGLTLLPSGQMVLSQGQCKDIESAYDNPQSLNSERLTRVFDQPACQSCTLTVYTERACAGESRQVTLTRGGRTGCKDGSLQSWSGEGGETQAYSYKLECA